MTVPHIAMCALYSPKMFVSFDKFHYIKILQPKEGKSGYIFLRTEISFFKKRKKEKRNSISTCLSFKRIYCLVIVLLGSKRTTYISLYICYFLIF